MAKVRLKPPPKIVNLAPPRTDETGPEAMRALGAEPSPGPATVSREAMRLAKRLKEEGVDFHSVGVSSTRITVYTSARPGSCGRVPLEWRGIQVTVVRSGRPRPA